MSALSGTASFKRMLVGGKPTKAALANTLRSINARRFAPTSDGQTITFGWVPMTDPLTEKLTTEDVFVGELVCLGFRQDERVVRAADVRDELKVRVRELSEKKERRISRQERAALKEKVLHELRAKAPIRRRVAELIWNPREGEARLFGASKQMTAALVELFEKTFEHSLDELETAMLAKRLGYTAARPAKKEESAKEDHQEAADGPPF